jgi:hypothetical protein
MENNKITNTEDIHVKVDQNNLIYIDPNSTIDSQGNISPRNIKAENLVMYVNLEADIIPRSILAADNTTNTLTSIAKGTLNFLKNNDGGDYDTSWTNSFLNSEEKKNGSGTLTGEFFQSDKSGQTFGIDNITINIKGFNSIPTINITFLDVRGKTLFESPENSPYKAFFHIPWPIFYLTVKGFYGKAIRYRLHMVKFTSKFNESNGNFEVNTSFVGSTYAYLSDIPLQGILNAPYLFPYESSKVTETNTGTNREKETVKKSTKGYEILKTVYNEYKLKGLIKEDFPVKTLKEVMTISKTLDTLLEKQIFDQVVDMRIFAGLKQFQEDIDKFEEAVIGWGKLNLESEPEPSLTQSTTDPNNPKLFFLVKSNPRTDRSKGIDGPDEDGTFEHLLKFYGDKIRESQLLSDVIQNQKIKQNPLLNKTGSNFSTKSLGISKVGNMELYIDDKNHPNKFIGIAIQKLLDDVREIRTKFEQQREKLQRQVEIKMNEIVRDKTKGFGFEPTIRNIFAVILANAEVLIRLMKDVHKKAFDQAETRKMVVSRFSKESMGDSIYPWPELKATVKGKENTIIYPGDPDWQAYLGSENAQRWPEVAFLETYIGVTTNKVDPLAEKEASINKLSNTIQNDSDIKKIKKISTANEVVNILPYVNKSPDSFIYELYERSFHYSVIESFNKTATWEKLADLEFGNIQESVEDENGLRKLLIQNIKDKTTLISQLEKLSPFEKYSYYKDSLPTTDYLKSFYEQSFIIEQYVSSNSVDDKKLYQFLDEELQNFTPETYRKNIYPYSSNVYLNYISTGVTSITDSLLNCRNFLSVDTTQGLVSGEVNPLFWLKNGVTSNLFSKKFTLTNTKVNILNTPFFHRQLFSDFNTIGSSSGKYAGSAYLLLNSLAFTDLDEIKIGTTKTDSKPYTFLTSSLFKEIGSSQYVPYHLILKWGSIYHRHKKFIKEGVDIIGDVYDGNSLVKEGAVKTGSTETLIGFQTNKLDGRTFFDNGNDLVFEPENGTYVSYEDQIFELDPIFDPGITFVVTGHTDVGIHPYYDDIFYNIVNGENYFDFVTGNTTDYYNKITGGTLNLKNDVLAYSGGTLYYWTQYVDDSKVNNKKNTFTLLPSTGDNLFKGKKQSLTNVNENPFSNNSFEIEEQNNFRIVWDDELISSNFSGQTFASPIEHTTTISGKYGIQNITDNYKKVMDLIATFNPTILDEFEKYFLLFASEKLNLSVSDKPFNGVVLDKFQDLLKEIVTVQKDVKNSTSNQISILKEKQKTKLEDISKLILSNDNLIKITIGNPKEFDPHTLIGFIGVDKKNTFKYNTYKGEFDGSQSDENVDLINLYLGPEPEYGDYQDFFIDNNIEFNEENVQIFRPLIYIYAGYKNSSFYNTTPNFKQYLNESIFTKSGGVDERLNTFLLTLIPKFQKEFKIQEDPTKITFFDGYNNKPLKVELYNFFKSMNDKWIAGNSIGQRSLLEEFLFLDRANKDIGNDYYFDLTRLTNMGDPKNSKQSLYGALSILLQGTGFDMRALPAYINFYGNTFSKNPKLVPSKRIAQNLFGTFLDVDYQESLPKIVIQYVGKNSTRPEMEKKGKFKFSDDSFNVGNVNNNPLMVTLPKVFKTGDLTKSNKVVAFEVSFGDQNQSIFKGIQLDQASIKNTSESFYVLENLARSESGSSSHNVDIGLYDYYRQASYTCDVTCMGNVMIQPTMYFYLKNVPMFKGTYWISEVAHSIKSGSITTTFKGSRIPYTALPDLKDSFMSSYRTLFDKLQQKAVNRVNGADKVTETSKTITNQNGEKFTFDMGDLKKSPSGEKLVEGDASFTPQAGIPFNGYADFRYITKVKYPNENSLWLRAIVARMGEKKYPIKDEVVMSVVSSNSKIITSPKFTWKQASEFTNDYYFYATKFLFDKVPASKVTTLTSTFFNPANNVTIIVPPKYELNDKTTTPIEFSGPIDIIRDEEPYGMVLSSKLMLDLGLQDGDIVYFNVG